LNDTNLKVGIGSEARIRQIGKLPFGAFYAERQVCVELLTNALCSTNVGKGREAVMTMIDYRFVLIQNLQF
jgi:hypothetical protein